VFSATFSLVKDTARVVQTCWAAKAHSLGTVPADGVRDCPVWIVWAVPVFLVWTVSCAQCGGQAISRKSRGNNERKKSQSQIGRQAAGREADETERCILQSMMQIVQSYDFVRKDVTPLLCQNRDGQVRQPIAGTHSVDRSLARRKSTLSVCFCASRFARPKFRPRAPHFLYLKHSAQGVVGVLSVYEVSFYTRYGTHRWYVGLTEKVDERKFELGGGPEHPGWCKAGTKRMQFRVLNGGPPENAGLALEALHTARC